MLFRSIPDELKESFYLYNQQVWRYTRQSRPELLQNYDKRGFITEEEAHHLDHRYSIFQGFIDDVCPSIIGSIHNLEFIPARENISKGTNCSITLEELEALINERK